MKPPTAIVLFTTVLAGVARAATAGGLVVAITVAFGGTGASLQSPAVVDFARDVQPILADRCISCHGPSRQENGYRLDRRADAFRGVLRPNIIPGSSDASPFYQRISSDRRGAQMPPAGPLPTEEQNALKRWIDQGAAWPDALANDAVLPPPDPDARRLIESIQRGDRTSTLSHLRSAPHVINRPGPAGSTPLMYAALAGDSTVVAEMLKAGGDPNLRNHAGASALMWAVEYPSVVQLLLGAGADPNAPSMSRRAPLSIAAILPKGDAVVRLLLSAGAKPTDVALPAAAQPLTAAAQHGRAATVRTLLAAGARDTNGDAMTWALRVDCRDCVAAIAAAQGWPPMSRSLLNLLPPLGVASETSLRDALAHGADPNVTSPRAWPVLARAAMAPEVVPATIQLLIDRGTAIEAATPDGSTALDMARRSGNTAAERVLARAGVRSMPAETPPARTFVRANTVDAAVRRSLPLLQRTAASFYKASGCVSCHHNSVAQMTVAAAKQAGFAIDERAAQEDITLTVKDVNASHDQAMQGIAAPGGHATTAGYILLGLAAANHARDTGTDALVRLLRMRQLDDGRWSSVYRPPIEASEITATAVSVRGLQRYGSTVDGSSDAMAVRAGIRWLDKAVPRDTEDRTFRLLGLTWGRAAATVRTAAMRDLVQTQRADGGWSQRPALSSDAYATGQALFALAEAGMRSDDRVYRRGVQFLLTTQLADGSWYVRSRSHPTQGPFESGFPHGVDQFISAAATNWATLALVRTAAAARPASAGKPVSLR